MNHFRGPERLIIRPPSEWRSLLLRVTRGCNWNRCKFCGIYPSMGQPEFSIRPVEEVKRDIDWYAENAYGFRTAFLGDADPLCRPLEESVEILSYLKEKIPHLTRVTAYARAGTIKKIGAEGMTRLAQGGLGRLHMGLESGHLETLKFHRKGQSPKVVISATRMLKEAGVETSFYVLLGLGGAEKWQEHIDDTIEVLNQADPEFIRVRRIWLYRRETGYGRGECPLWEDIRNGTFTEQSAEGTVHELRRLISGLGDIHGQFMCDHANNYVHVAGQLPEDRELMLQEIDRFLSLPKEVREKHYRATGSRI